MTQDNSGSSFARNGFCRLRAGFLEAKRLTTIQAEKLSTAAVNGAATVSSFLAQPGLLKWSEQLTQSSPNAYDKALDAEYCAYRVIVNTQIASS